MPIADGDQPIRILHLSDFHFRAGTAWDADPVLRDLACVLAEEVAAGLAPDLVAITGDLAFSGRAEEYTLARDWLEQALWPVLTPKGAQPLQRDRLLLVPGNHDADRNVVGFVTTAVQEYLLARASQEDIASILGNPRERQVLLNRHAAYLKFCRQWLGTPKASPWWQRSIEIRGQRLHIAGLNSAWMACGDQDRGRLLLGRWQVNATVHAPEGERADWRVALLHHPWDYLAEFDFQEARQVIHLHRDLVLRGHLHAGEASAVRAPDPARASLELAAGGLYAGSRRPNTFHWIELWPKPRRIRVLFRDWVKGAWEIDRNQPGCPDGVAEFSLALPHPASSPMARQPPTADPRKYLEDIWSETAHIEIRGLVTGRPDAHRFPIADVYIELQATGAWDADGYPVGSKQSAAEPKTHSKGPDARTNNALRDALIAPRLVILGDPGCGKTTFLRWVAHCLAADRLGRDPGAAARYLGLAKVRLPILVPIADWVHYIEYTKSQKNGPTLPDSAEWLPAYLGARASENRQRLDADDFLRLLDSGEALILLDGLDEAPDRLQRERAVRRIEHLAQAWPDCPLVVTSRPAAYRDRAVLAGFVNTTIDALDPAAIEGFLARWSRALFPERPERAAAHHQELAAALASRREIRLLARNTVMLTALAVVHWNDKRLPEQRAEVYESIVRWLLLAREQRPGRERPERCRQLLADLALAMQADPQGRQVLVSRRWAAERIAHRFAAGADGNPIDQAETFLAGEAIDNGIVVRRGHQLRFWHLTFQEYLAAQALAGRISAERNALLLDSGADSIPAIYRPDWRETVLILGGVLYLQGQDQVDSLLGAILDRLGPSPSRAEQARAAGLLGALVRDLAPFAYRPTDPRYAQIRDAALAVFDPRLAQSIPIPDRIAAADALARAGDPRLGWTAPDRWIDLPGGHCAMGAQCTDQAAPGYDPDARGAESPVHAVAISALRIARFPVTVAEYAAFLDDERHRDSRWWWVGGADAPIEPDDWWSQQAYPSRPVVNISWYQATAYCAWLTDRLIGFIQAQDAAQLLPGQAVRLPTEAEWEYAARGESGRRYPWGEETPDAQRVNCDLTKVGHLTSVGIFPGDCTPDGVLDLAGNVWEWCLDAYREDFYAECRGQGTLPDPLAQGDGEVSRVLRGGAFPFGASDLRASNRHGLGPETRYRHVGFRCVLALPRGARAVAERQAMELIKLGRAGRFDSAVDLLGQWLTGVEGADPLLLRLRDVARYFQSAAGSTMPYNRLRYLDQAGRALAAIRNSSHTAGGQPAPAFFPVLDCWEALLAEQRGDAEARAAGQLPNPFRAGDPLTLEDGQEVFRGREHLVERLETLLADPSASVSVALIGPRRCGKTSLLCMLPALLPDTLCVFFSIQGNAIDPQAGFFPSLARVALAQARVERGLELPPWPDGPPFEAASEWLRTLDEAIGDGRILLCIDEFERLETLFPGDRRALLQFMGLLRATIQHRRRVRLLVAGAAPFNELDSVWNDHFVNVRELRVGHLDQQTARDLLIRPLPDFPAHAIPLSVAAAIVARTGGQPYLLQLYGSLLVTRLNAMQRRSAALDDLPQIEEEVLSQVTYYFRDLYESAPDAARAGLCALARDQVPTIDPQTRRWLRRRELMTDEQRIGIPVFGRWIIEEVGS